MKTSQAQCAVLVVEDEAVIRMYAVAMLEDAGFHVLEAQDGKAALAILAEHDEIGILLTDVRMPGQPDGLQLVGQVQRDHPQIHAIVVSGNTSAEEAYRAGAVRFIPKPYLPGTIVTAVCEVMRMDPGCEPVSVPRGARARMSYAVRAR